MALKDGPGEGGWAVFAEKVVAERDALQVKFDELQAKFDECGHVMSWRQAEEREALRIENAALKAEGSRLREALEAISRAADEHGCFCDDCTCSGCGSNHEPCDWYNARESARAALAKAGGK